MQLEIGRLDQGLRNRSCLCWSDFCALILDHSPTDPSSDSEPSLTIDNLNGIAHSVAGQSIIFHSVFVVGDHLSVYSSRYSILQKHISEALTCKIVHVKDGVILESDRHIYQRDEISLAFDSVPTSRAKSLCM